MNNMDDWLFFGLMWIVAGGIMFYLALSVERL